MGSINRDTAIWGATTRRLIAICTAALVGLVALAAGAATNHSSASATASMVSIIVRESANAGTSVEQAVLAGGGRITYQLPILNGFSAIVPATVLGSLAGMREVTALSPDAPINTNSYDPISDNGSLYSVNDIVGSKYFPNGGSGIGVALIDTGVVPQSGALANTQIVNGPDLSFDSQNSHLAHLDPYGHGTFMAGIIAGNNPAVGPFNGVSPQAKIINVKVGAANGAADVSQVIAAIDWVVQHRNDPGLNIKVLNLSLGYNSSQPYTVDPLAYAAEQAWFHGITVVAAAGNRGTTAGHLDSPAYDPYVIAVGAASYDGLNNSGLRNFSMTSYSSRGDGVRNPDLVALGNHVVSALVPGSYVNQTYGSTGNVDGKVFFRGSGTSEAAAEISGAVADLLGVNGNLTPDGVKALLVGTTWVNLPNVSWQHPTEQGNGLFNVLGASQQAFNATYTTAVQRFPRSSGSGSLEGTRGGKDLVLNSAPSPTPTATSTPSTGSLVEAISAGGLAVNQYRADPGFTQGIPWTGSPVSVDTSGVADPTPGAVYQSGRWGSNFTYTIGGLTAGGSYRLELQWAETYWPQAGQRVFNVAVGGTQVLSNFDVLANAGGFGKAIARSFALSADSNGQIVLSLSRGSADNPFLNGLELWQTAPGVALTGNQDIFGRAWNSAQMAAAEASGSTWSGGNWNGSTWSGSTWSGSTWSGSTWSGSTWSGSTWSGSTWSGSTWSGSTWSGGTWSGGTWSGDLWATASWS